jgi:hypothetical protein
MGTEIPGSMDNAETLRTQIQTSLTVRRPGKALAGVQTDLEHGSKFVDSLARLLHVGW